MKKSIIMLFAFALVLGLSQCKKKVETISSVPASVYITLDVDGGDKVIVNPYHSPTYASVTFEQGDVIYVGNNGAYCGFLTYNGTKFAGNITPTSDNDADYLHFYFMGNKGPQSKPTSVNISDQTAKYPVISYGRSIQMYNSGTTSYSTTLYNKCSIMKFPIAGAGTDTAVTITGMKNVVTVDFSKNSTGPTANPYSYSMDGNGAITLHSENINEKWAIVLPQDAVNAQLQASGYDTETVSVPAISTNEYHNNDIGEITLTTASHFTEALFRVAAGRQVYFSSGNLQYQASTSTWRFAKHQWDYVGTQTPDPEGYVGGTVIGSDNANISETYGGWIDLFGWGTSGYDYGAVAYQPWSISSNPTEYGPRVGNLTGMSDWGYNAISNGGNTENSGWRTLTNEEWEYLLRYRTGIRYAKANVAGVNGVILLPDGWSASTYPLSATNTGNVDYTANDISLNDWQVLELAGAVFLPAAGARTYGTRVDVVTCSGAYWSATRWSSANDSFAYGWSFSPITYDSFWADRNKARSVRLVRNN